MLRGDTLLYLVQVDTGSMTERVSTVAATKCLPTTQTRQIAESKMHCCCRFPTDSLRATKRRVTGRETEKGEVKSKATEGV